MMMLQRALRYIEVGWPVFPLAPGEKKPLIVSAHKAGVECRGECGAHGHGLYDATLDPELASRWWGEDGEPGANVGLRAGVRWWVLDVDAKAPKSGGLTGYEMLTLLESTHGALPETLTVRTPGGGEHRFFSLPNDRVIPSRARIKAPDGRPTALDVRGVGGYVVGEPSVVDGKAYALHVRARLANAPEWLLELVAPYRKESKAPAKTILVDLGATGTRYGSTALRNAVDAIQRAGEGERHHAIFASAAALGELVAGRAVGLSAAACEESLLAAAQSIGKPYREALRTIRDGLNKGAQNPKVPELRFQQRSTQQHRVDPNPEPQAQPQSEPEQPPPPDDPEALPPGERSVLVVNRDRLDVLEDAWQLVVDNNAPPVLYVQQGAIVDVFAPVDAPATIRALAPVHVGARLVRVARCRKRIVKNGDTVLIATEPPEGLVADMHAQPSTLLPVLESIVRSPVFAAGGRLVSSPGYDVGARLFYSPPVGFVVPPINMRPTRADIEDAKALFFDPTDGVFGEFPFSTPSDMAHAASLLILPFVRRYISGPTPLHLIEAAERGTGKTLLAQLLTCLSLGEFADAAPLSDQDDEVRKKLTSSFMARKPVLFFDNLEGRVDAPALCVAITSTRWEDRILGQSKDASLPIHTIFVASGNNCELSTDMARRVIRTRLDRKMERPWEHGIRRRDVRSWVLDNRGELVAAVLTLIQSWVDAGCPRGSQHLGSFESWAYTIGGILEHVGIPGFLGNAGEMYEMADPVHLEWRGLAIEWWHAHADNWVTATVLAKVADEHDLMTTVLATANSERAKASRIGRGLGKQRGRIFSGLRVETRIEGSQTMYRLTVADPLTAPSRALNRALG